MSNNLCDLDGRGRDWLDAISLYLNTESVQDRVLVSQAADVSTEGTVQGDALGLGSAPQYQEGPAATYMTKPVMHHPIVTPTATTTTLPVYEKHHMAPGTTQLPHYASPFYLKTTGCSLTPHDDFSLSSSSTCYFDVGPADAVPDGCISSFHEKKQVMGNVVRLNTEEAIPRRALLFSCSPEPSAENMQQDTSSVKINSILKPKRQRTLFNKEQNGIFAEEFSKCQNPRRTELERIAKRAGVTLETARMKYKNLRAKLKKQRNT